MVVGECGGLSRGYGWFLQGEDWAGIVLNQKGLDLECKDGSSEYCVI